MPPSAMKSGLLRRFKAASLSQLGPPAYVRKYVPPGPEPAGTKLDGT